MKIRIKGRAGKNLKLQRIKSGVKKSQVINLLI